MKRMRKLIVAAFFALGLTAQNAFAFTDTAVLIVEVGTASGIETGRLLSSLDQNKIGIEIRGGTVQFQIPAQGAYTLTVNDLSGRQVWKEQSKTSSGRAEWKFGGRAAQGAYIARLVQGENVVMQKFMVGQ